MKKRRSVPNVVDLPDNAQWIDGCVGKMFIKDDGTVWSTAKGKWMQIKPTFHKRQGCCLVSVYYNDGVTDKKRVHRMIAEAYVPNPNNYKFVAPIDGDIRNTHPSNLEWVKVNRKEKKK